MAQPVHRTVLAAAVGTIVFVLLRVSVHRERPDRRIVNAKIGAS